MCSRGALLQADPHARGSPETRAEATIPQRICSGHEETEEARAASWSRDLHRHPSLVTRPRSPRTGLRFRVDARAPATDDGYAGLGVVRSLGSPAPPALAFLSRPEPIARRLAR